MGHPVPHEPGQRWRGATRGLGTAVWHVGRCSLQNGLERIALQGPVKSLKKIKIIQKIRTLYAE